MAHWGIKIKVPLTVNPAWPAGNSFALTLEEALFEITVRANEDSADQWLLDSVPNTLDDEFRAGLGLSGGGFNHNAYSVQINNRFPGFTGLDYTKTMATVAGMITANECRKNKMDSSQLIRLWREKAGISDYTADALCAISGGIQYYYQMGHEQHSFRIYCPHGLKLVLGGQNEGWESKNSTQGKDIGLLPAILRSLERFDTGQLRKIYHLTPQLWSGNGLISIMEASSAVMFGNSYRNPLFYAVFENSVESDAFVKDLEKAGWEGKFILSDLSNTGAERQ